MNNYNKFLLEKKINRIKLFWIIIFSFIILIAISISISTIFVSIINNQTNNHLGNSTGTFNGPSNSGYSFNFTPIVLFLILIIPIILVTKVGYNYQINDLIKQFYSSISIVKTDHLHGEIPITEASKLNVEWSSVKGYFIIKFNTDVLVYAKSSELYWKILFLRHKILMNTLEN